MRPSLLLLAVAMSGGCGLISSDVSDFPLSIKDRTFTIDAEGWMLDGGQVGDFLATDCASTPTVCDSAAKQACSGCSGQCNATTNTCDLRLPVGLFDQVDLMMEQSELSSIDKEKGIKVTIDGASYQVTTNTLNVTTPELVIYVAPASVTDPTDPGAKPIGRVAGIAAGQTTGETDIEYTETGKADLAAAMTNFTTPFNLLVGSTLEVSAGDPVPAGSLAAVVRIKAHAGI